MSSSTNGQNNCCSINNYGGWNGDYISNSGPYTSQQMIPAPKVLKSEVGTASSAENSEAHQTNSRYIDSQCSSSSQALLQSDCIIAGETLSAAQFGPLNCRVDNSLLVLTKKFMQLQPQANEDGVSFFLSYVFCFNF
ncbi:unnamed protein product [Onchocerca flexuosa]|uniref:Uncharacterized protein n=1 Tax=Onchocerca flexuosa TaxID=387005 RepID=A0A183I6D0_9BILA|nr:unnamed protein product [Onchocerca flexuosa]